MNLSNSNTSLLSQVGLPEGLSRSIGFLLNRNGRVVRDRVEKALEPAGLTVRELGFLRILSDRGGLTQQALGNLHHIDRTTTVQVIDELERRQLIVRVENEKDRRSYLLHLTPRGRKTLAKAGKLAEKEQIKFLEKLSPDEQESLRSILIKLLATTTES